VLAYLAQGPEFNLQPSKRGLEDSAIFGNRKRKEAGLEKNMGVI
jgi:hypothetical protein